jgi:protein-disulfide isomerase
MRSRSRKLLVVAGLGAVLSATALITASVVTGGSKPKRSSAPAAPSVLRAVPQHGLVLGSPSAPVTLVEFADLQCPYCGIVARDALPSIVRDYVRTGKVRVVFEGLAFLGPDSDTALRAVLAAGRQNRAWSMLEGLYQRQGGENSGWVTEGLLRQVGGEIAGLDTARMLRDRSSVDREIAAAQRLAERVGVTGTPSFLAGRSGGRLRPVELTELTADALQPRLDHLLAS